MLMGENSRAVADRVDVKMKEINRSLPPGVIARTLYTRTKLVDATIDTVKKNLFEGALLVMAILFALLGNWRAALITTFVIPLSMMFAITGMVTNKVSANLMSLGALDFGLIVDGAVIIVENCMRRLTNEQARLGRLLAHEERLRTVREATKEVITPSIFGAIIIMVVYLPILTLRAWREMFVPMAATVLLALLGAMIFSPHRFSGRDLHLAGRETCGKGERFHASSETLLCAATRPSIAETRTYPERCRNRAGSQFRPLHAARRRIHSDAR